MVRSSQRSLFMLDLDLHRSFGLPYKPLENTTLNEKFGVLTATVPDDVMKYPLLHYYGIGTGGSLILEDTEGYTFNEHSPLDGCLFNHVPFIMRESHKDLSKEERAKYRMRVIETINGREYACYYLKKIDTIDIKQIFYSVRTLVDNITGEQTPILSPLDLTAEPVLTPKPSNRTLSYKNVADLDYATYINKLIFSFTVVDFNELAEVFKIKQIQNTHLTEAGIFAGIDVDVGEHKELIYTQCMYFVQITLKILQTLTKKNNTNVIVELGGMEPYIKGMGNV